jgi:hypothetical protein
MEPYPPYRVVARSGLFCLGYATMGDDFQGIPHGLSSLMVRPVGRHTSNVHINPINDDTPREPPMQMKDTTFHCPRIHFIMSVIDKVDDPTRVIISYGVNDCLTR